MMIAAAVSTFAGCQDELDQNKVKKGNYVSFAISEDKTRTAYDPDNNLQINWSEGDAVRIFCDEAEDVKQADYTVAQIEKNTGKLVYNSAGLAWGGDTDMHNFYAVYPADDSKVSVDASTGIATFTVNHSQTCTVQGEAVNNHYSTLPDMKEAYMVANLSTTPIPEVALNFKPIMTTLEITVQGAATENKRDVTFSGISVINKKATYPGVSEGKFKYDIAKKVMSEEGVEKATTETYYVGIKNGNDTWLDLKAGESITLTVFLPPVVINNDNQVTIQVHATGELNAIIGGRTDKNGKETNIAPSAKAKITLPNMPEAKSGNNWITPLDDKIYVQQLSIPGTHDSGTKDVESLLSFKGNTQSFTIKEQWDMGIRAFDFRTAYNSDENKMWLWHGFTATTESLESALSTISSALEIDKGEFAIIQFRHEDETFPVFGQKSAGLTQKNTDESKWKSEMYSVLKTFDNKIIQWKPELTIGECRGKIIILTRNEYDNRVKGGLIANWPQNTYGEASITSNGKTATYLVQDFYKYSADSDVQTKINYVEDTYKKTKKFSDINSDYFKNKTWGLNHTSGYKGTQTAILKINIELGVTEQYQRNAANINPTIYKDLMEETEFGPTGIVFMDWVGTREASSYTVYGDLLPQAIIDNNYKYRMLRKGE